MQCYVIIPARLASTRLPEKALADIIGKPMIQHVYEKAVAANVGKVIVATDDNKIISVVKDFGGESCLTKTTHNSGTERIAEVIDIYNIKSTDVVLNIQGDEPLINPLAIIKLKETLINSPYNMASICEPIFSIAEIFDPGIVKIVKDINDCAMYFSRAPIPWHRQEFSQKEKKLPSQLNYFKHIGVYAYYASFVQKYVKLAPSPFELAESLEQLRILWHGEKIKLSVMPNASGPSVDTSEDLKKVVAILQQKKCCC